MMNMPEPTESNLRKVYADATEHKADWGDWLFVVFMLGMVFGGMYAAAAMIWSAMQ